MHVRGERGGVESDVVQGCYDGFPWYLWACIIKWVFGRRVDWNWNWDWDQIELCKAQIRRVGVVGPLETIKIHIYTYIIPSIPTHPTPCAHLPPPTQPYSSLNPHRPV